MRTGKTTLCLKKIAYLVLAKAQKDDKLCPNICLQIFHPSKAEVAKLVDALDSESSPVKGVGVRVPSSAPSKTTLPILKFSP